MRILYVGRLGPHDTSTYRARAIARLGHEISEFDTAPYYDSGHPLIARLRISTLVGPTVRRLNHDLLEAARRCRPQVIWFDKPLYVWPETVRQLRASGAYSIHFTIDNPFGPRGDPGWRLIRAAIPNYDLHLVQREVNLADYRTAGARDVRLFRTAYEPTLHVPPPADWSDTDRINDVVYIGAPYDDRPRFMIELWKTHGIRVRIWGSPMWNRALPADARAALWQGSELWNDDYRTTIWRSRLCLAFVTHSNCDDVAHKSFEIAAAGGTLLAEDTPGHRAHFAADQEALFFTSVDDCAAQIRRALPDQDLRNRIGRAAAARAVASGYGNDARIGAVLADVERRLQIPA